MQKRIILLLCVFILISTSISADTFTLDQDIGDLGFAGAFFDATSKWHHATYMKRELNPELETNQKLTADDIWVEVECQVLIKEYTTRNEAVKWAYDDNGFDRGQKIERSGESIYRIPTGKGDNSYAYGWTHDMLGITLAFTSQSPYSFYFSTSCEQLVEPYLEKYPSDIAGIVEKTRDEIDAERNAAEQAQKQSSLDKWREGRTVFRPNVTYKKTPQDEDDLKKPDVVDHAPVSGEYLILTRESGSGGGGPKPAGLERNRSRSQRNSNTSSVVISTIINLPNSSLGHKNQSIFLSNKTIKTENTSPNIAEENKTSNNTAFQTTTPSDSEKLPPIPKRNPIERLLRWLRSMV